MNIGVIGVNFRSADLSFREKMAQRIDQIEKATCFQNIYRVLLSTCNRFEIYFSAQNPSEAHSFFLEHLRKDLKEDCGFKLYAYFGKECFHHLCRVTSGLDSAILAETEIQGQVKRAYQEACKNQLNSELHFIFQKSLKIGKTTRSEIPLCPKMPTLSSTLKKMLVTLAAQKDHPKILFVGTSLMNEQLIRLLRPLNMDLFVSSRSDERLKAFSKEHHLQAFAWKHLKYWPYFDALILATNDPKVLIHPKENMVDKTRLILDLSVPRNVCPKVHGQFGVQLWNIDQLNKMVRKYRKVKAKDLLKVDFQVQCAVFTQWSLFKHRKEYAQRMRFAI